MDAGEGACASSGSSELSAFRVGRCWGVPTPVALTGCAGAAQLAPPRRGRSPAAPAAATWEGQYPQTLRKTAQYEARVLPRAGRCSLRLLFRQRCRTTPWPYGRWIRNAALWRAEQSSVLVWVPVAEHTVSGHLLTQAGGWYFRPLGNAELETRASESCGFRRGRCGSPLTWNGCWPRSRRCPGIC